MLISFKKVADKQFSPALFGNFSTYYLRLIVSIGVMAGMAGCSDVFAPSVREICREHPELCNDLNPDGWCRAQKAEVIKHRFSHQDKQDDAAKYELLLKFEAYQECIEKASGIQHIKYREKEKGRMLGVLTAQRELKRLARETRGSADPYLSFYHWSRFGDERALAQFLSLAQTDALDTPELQTALASIQMKRDLDATKHTLYKALSLYRGEKDVDKEIFTTLTTVALEQENYRLAYVWSLVAAEYNNPIQAEQRAEWAQQFNLPVDILQAVAAEIIDAIESGDFDAAKLGLGRL